jgi:hypothetical protein
MFNHRLLQPGGSAMAIDKGQSGNSPSKMLIWAIGGAFLAIAGFFLLTEHRAHLFGALPWLLILACPLMHIFMHHGHGGHGDHGDSGKPKASTDHQHPKS